MYGIYASDYRKKRTVTKRNYVLIVYTEVYTSRTENTEIMGTSPIFRKLIIAQDHYVPLCITELRLHGVKVWKFTGRN